MKKSIYLYRYCHNCWMSLVCLYAFNAISARRGYCGQHGGCHGLSEARAVFCKANCDTGWLFFTRSQNQLQLTNFQALVQLGVYRLHDLESQSFADLHPLPDPHDRRASVYKTSSTMSDQQMASILNFLSPLLCSCVAPHLTVAVEPRSDCWTNALT